MATRFYLPASTAATPISPTPDAAWEDQSALGRALMSPTPISDAMADVSFDDADATNKDVLLRQFVSAELTPRQLITASQAVAFACLVYEPNQGNNMFLAAGLRVLNDSTVKKTVLSVTRDGQEISNLSIRSRYLSATSAAGHYVTVDNDHLVLEVGAGGDPAVGEAHDFTLRLGDAAASDVPASDGDTNDYNPWFQLNDSLIFTAFPTTGWSELLANALVPYANSATTAYSISGAEPQLIKSHQTNTAGKKYFEVLVGAVGVSTSYVGIANATAALNEAMGQSTNSCGYDPSGAVYANSSLIGSIDAYVDTDRVSVALDFTAKKIWLKVNTGDWNADAGADPAAGTGGLDVASVINADGTIHAAVGFDDTGASLTCGLNDAGFLYSPPSGFTAWITAAADFVRYGVIGGGCGNAIIGG